MATPNPDRLYNLAATLLVSVTDALRTVHPLAEGAEEGDASDTMPRMVCVTPGPMAHEGCCEGQVTVHVEGMYGTTEFPQPQGRAGELCVPPNAAVTLVITALRCHPMDGSAEWGGPGCEELQPVAQLLYRDAWAIWTGAVCTVQEWVENDTHEALVQPMTPVDSEGGCVGFEQRVLVELDASCNCPPVAP